MRVFGLLDKTKVPKLPREVFKDGCDDKSGSRDKNLQE